MIVRSRFGYVRLGATAAATLLAPPCLADGAARPALGACLEALSDATKPTISCTYKALLTDKERSDIRALTRQVVQDVTCEVRVEIARTLVTPALGSGDHEFESPPQPVHCEIKTSGDKIPIDATFAPRVTFKNGVAVEGSPGLANVTGVNAYLAWPVVQYVNRSAGIQRDMLAMINAYKTARPSERADLAAITFVR